MEDNSAKIFIQEVFSMPMYFVGTDISKYKHDCCIISAADQQIISKFTITNDKDGF